MENILAFLSKWSPHIWLLFSIYGVLLSIPLFRKSQESLTILSVRKDEQRAWRFWRRHTLSFLIMHSSYVFVGLVSVAKLHNVWTQFITLVVLLGTPPFLAWRSYDSLRFMGGKRD